MFLAIQARAHAFINHNYIYLSTQLMQEVLALVARLFHYLGFFPIIFCAGKNLHSLSISHIPILQEVTFVAL
jgi:hypothetical protein